MLAPWSTTMRGELRSGLPAATSVPHFSSEIPQDAFLSNDLLTRYGRILSISYTCLTLRRKRYT